MNELIEIGVYPVRWVSVDFMYLTFEFFYPIGSDVVHDIFELIDFN